ncbi:MAG: type II/IV secretion system protein [Acidobacteria bacterium]|nr:type II/IV secretion system protein [Acidobacteriota bacterium]
MNKNKDIIKFRSFNNNEALDEIEEAKALSARYSLQYVNLEKYKVDSSLFQMIPVDLMFKYNFIPLGQQNDIITIAMSDPSDLRVIDELEVILGKVISVSVATPSAIQEILKKSESSQRILEEATEDFKLKTIEGDDEEISLIPGGEEESSPMIKLIDSTIFNAIQRRASDIHIETREKEVLIKYRVDGILYPAMDPIDKKHHSTIISRIKVMSDLDITEKRVPQDGRFQMKFKKRNVDFRVSIMPNIHGEDAVLRILDKELINKKFKNLNLEILGFEKHDLAIIHKFISEPYGMFLVTGPTGSGKTTTLYAALSEIRSEEDKIITIEDPVEYQIDGITQVPVNEKKGLTFSRGLRSILRHDPDKIMVGEIRDEETAAIAIQSALTGHLVFTTVHANNVVDVIGRFLNMKVETYNFVSALNCVLAQRLVRVLCKCKHKYSITQKIAKENGINYSKYQDYPFYRAEGCIECGGTGYTGRTVIAEIMVMSDKLREMIIEKKPSAEIRKEAIKEGMSELRTSAVKKVISGMTSLEEINKVTFVVYKNL